MNDPAFRTLVPGTAEGPVARLTAPLSLWGGLDLDTGRICDVSHPQCGMALAGTILVMPGARGSSSSSSALVEAVRRGIAPRAIILSRVDPILVIGGLVAFDLYGIELPIVLAEQAGWETVPADGTLRIEASESRGISLVHI
jgi:predicted aconitase with swiveling domain